MKRAPAVIDMRLGLLRARRFMETGAEEFDRLVRAVVIRFCTQAPRPIALDELPRFTAQLWRLACDRGLPRPLAEGEIGTPGGMSEAECAALVARVMEGIHESSLADVGRQLIKACFYPEFTVCRDSFREVARDGACRRQELDRARGRISGAHCVDCPHWVALAPAEHVVYLRQEWHRNPELLTAHQGVFLPEDFRALRIWLHGTARRLPKMG